MISDFNQFVIRIINFFIKMDEYGTRCSTFLTVTKNDNVYFEERGYVPESVNSFRFDTRKLDKNEKNIDDSSAH